MREADGVLIADVTDRASLERVLAQITSEHGAPSLLVNNAGIDAPPGSDEGSFGRALDVNVEDVFNATQVFGGPMCENRRGSIVNIGSLYASIAPIPELYDHIETRFTKPAVNRGPSRPVSRTPVRAVEGGGMRRRRVLFAGRVDELRRASSRDRAPVPTNGSAGRVGADRGWR